VTLSQELGLNGEDEDEEDDLSDLDIRISRKCYVHFVAIAHHCLTLFDHAQNESEIPMRHVQMILGPNRKRTQYDPAGTTLMK
jgi:hypothetical protein